nr:nucleic acid-binding, OB-fold protein [Tanacetum cinerariifolium]
MTKTCISDLKPGAKNKILEARVYRKWINRNPPRPAPTEYCCILLDREGNAIQANMGLQYILYFSSLLQEGSAYKISGFITDKQLSTDTGYRNNSQIREIYKVRKHIVRRISKALLQLCIIQPVRVQNASQRHLDSSETADTYSGDVVELTLWDDMARTFKKDTYDKIENHVIIAVSSCKVPKYGGLQLSATPATYYYLNLDIPDLEAIRDQYRAQLSLNPPLEISKERCHDLDQEKTRNRFPLSTLLQQIPEGYRAVRFTCQGTITAINTARDCTINPVATTYKRLLMETARVNVRTTDRIQNPHTGTISRQLSRTDHLQLKFTFFTPNADFLTGSDCSESVKKYYIPHPRDFPTEILALHYNLLCEKCRVDFLFDDILDKPLQITAGPKNPRELEGQKNHHPI